MKVCLTKSSIIAALLSLAAPLLAATVQVSPIPGANAIAQAIDSAADGDTLVLANGTYNGQVIVNKSLVIRGVNADSPPTITGSWFTVNGTGIKVVLQGLGFASTLHLEVGADIQIIENTFYTGASIIGGAYITGQGDGRLAIIGNRMAVDSAIVDISADDAYIAGNRLDRGWISALAPVWIVGNDVNGSPNVNPVNVVASGNVKIIGNRIRGNVGGMSGGSIAPVSVGAPRSLVVSNLLRISYSGSGGCALAVGISLSPTNMANVHNNIVEGSSGMGCNRWAGIEVPNASSSVSGNMVINFIDAGAGRGSAFTGAFSPENLCWKTDANNCGIVADPKFVDTVNYRLAAGSPAIDAGPTSPFLVDRDRTRNDLGIHGGPWGIDQYDAQRDPLYFGPFVFPLFDANTSFVDGALQVRALGVARLR